MINWGGSKWITIDNFRCDMICIWSIEIHHFWWSFPTIVFDSCASIYCHFEEKTLIIEIWWIKFWLKSFLELHMHFNGFMCIRMHKLHAECQIQVDACDWSQTVSSLVFQISFQNTQRQKSYRNFLSDRSELWPSIYTYPIILKQSTAETSRIGTPPKFLSRPKSPSRNDPNSVICTATMLKLFGLVYCHILRLKNRVFFAQIYGKLEAVHTPLKM